MVPDFEPGKNAKYPRNTSLCVPSTSQIYPLDSAKIENSCGFFLRPETTEGLTEHIAAPKFKVKVFLDFLVERFGSGPWRR
jgi:hypothetical protein